MRADHSLASPLIIAGEQKSWVPISADQYPKNIY